MPPPILRPQVFSELIPKGSASMTILTSGLDDDEEDGEEELDAEELDTDDNAAEEGADAAGGRHKGSKAKAAPKSSSKKKRGSTPTRGTSSAVAELRNMVETYKGLRIQASFTDAGESDRNSLLSGGQMALTSLALIFAIQVSSVSAA